MAHFSFIKWLASILLLVPVLAQSAPKQSNINIDPQANVNIYSGIVEEYLAGVLRTARAIAITAEAKSGKWEEIKPILDLFSKDLSTDATIWYVMPDGSYYSTESGKLTNQNLTDRPYFPRLMSGDNVIGDLVVSKSTGHRSVIIAAPVKIKDKVIAGIGISIRARLLSELVDSYTTFPENTYFYALDPNAKIALHRYEDRIFKKVSEVGNEKLEAEFKNQFSKNDGSFEYTLNKKRMAATFKKSHYLGWYFFIAQEKR